MQLAINQLVAFFVLSFFINTNFFIHGEVQKLSYFCSIKFFINYPIN